MEIAGKFSTDAFDYFTRFRCSFYSSEYDFQSIKSRRCKAFTDLRLALECVLKAYIALRQPFSSGGKELIDSVESHKHNIKKLLQEALSLWKINLDPEIEKVILECSELNMGIRYAFDAFDFREVNQDLYYRTIGSDSWIIKLRDTVELLIKRQHSILNKRSKVVCAADIPLEQLMSVPYSKYRKQKNK